MLKRCGLAGFVSLLVWLTSCGSEEGLSTLRQDPVASVELGQSTLTATVEKGANSSLGQPTSAVIRRTFQPRPGVELSDLLTDALEKVSAEGWDLEEEDPGRFYRGTKVIDDQTVELSVYTNNDAEVILNLQFAR